MRVASAVRRRLSSSPSAAAAAAAAAAVDAFRRFGHLRARLSPLAGAAVRAGPAAADGEQLLLAATSAADVGGAAPPPALARAYCGAVGFEFMHCATRAERDFFARAAEEQEQQQRLRASPAELRNAARLMLSGHELEAFLGRKWTGLKHYGGSGCEALLPAVDAVLAASGAARVTSVVVGQAHRGRLALLVALLGYPARKLFHKLDGNDDIPLALPGLDDVSSHVYASGERHGVRFSLLPNPSHLEVINGAVLGKVRAQRDVGESSMALLIHGDAAFSGQGSVAESLAMSQTRAYGVGGAVHIVTNNLLGFTAAAEVGRSSTYASDAAKAIDAPVLHVSAESPADVIFACRLAVDYRARFGRDAFVDLIGYRRSGHNEVDEPGFTSPALYKEIRARAPLALGFADETLGRAAREAQQVKFVAHLEAELSAARAQLSAETGATGLGSGAASSEAGDHVVADGTAFGGKWRGVRLARSSAELLEQPTTGVALDALRAMGRASVAVPPPPFAVHERLQRSHVGSRLAALEKPEHAHAIDWATAEALALLSLGGEGRRVRMSGQDAERGTFSQRHAVLVCAGVDGGSEARHCALGAASDGRVEVHSSLLSELAPLAFEYGYSLESPQALVLWEAQFGDFANQAQMIVDNLIATSESKWLRSTGLVLLLPHGQDGAGPEHSSARIERFLQLANGRAWEGAASLLGDTADKARDEPLNLLLAQPTTPANFFHLLRRQLHRPFRKPLVVATPKQLLRLDEARSALSEMGPGTAFRPVLGDELAERDPARVERIVLCSGKLFYELDAVRRKSPGTAPRVALVRIEELAPWPAADVARELARYSSARELVYAQDEPANAGAWAYANMHLAAAGVGGVRYAGRPALATAAAGVKKRNAAMQDAVVRLALGMS
jgi:2-oxoglutarate dehydrogenase complex dehydrogenase (E1) component-like enzyme